MNVLFIKREFKNNCIQTHLLIRLNSFFCDSPNNNSPKYNFIPLSFSTCKKRFPAEQATVTCRIT